MTASPQPVTTPAVPPPQPVPAKAPAPHKPLWLKPLPFVLLLLIAGAAIAWYTLRQQPKTPVPLAGPKTAKTFVGPFQRTLRMSGVTSARNFVNTTAPLLRGPENRGSLVLTYLVNSGATVKKGERI